MFKVQGLKFQVCHSELKLDWIKCFLICEHTSAANWRSKSSLSGSPLDFYFASLHTIRPLASGLLYISYAPFVPMGLGFKFPHFQITSPISNLKSQISNSTILQSFPNFQIPSFPNSFLFLPVYKNVYNKETSPNVKPIRRVPLKVEFDGL
ncbi:MAG: hypothetical protein CFE24_12695 [Flavobacterium sp. BFFFF2]|nr:MAG: hypothetical protein CFE24_12695 [Flavobacterium sp. BFFFF2]